MAIQATENTDHDEKIRENMDNMYRWTRHIYDLTRKYYLLGRDRLIETLDAKDDEHICEVGCGTARNLIKIAKRYPNAHFYGLDASDEMLKTARKNIHGAHQRENIILKQGFSQNFQPNILFNTNKPLNKIVFSYALSIIPPWKESINHALELLPQGGEIHIVDFGGQEDLPRWFRKILFWWLGLFHVYHKPEILNYLKQTETDGQGSLKIEHLYKGYTYHAIFTKA